MPFSAMAMPQKVPTTTMTHAAMAELPHGLAYGTHAAVPLPGSVEAMWAHVEGQVALEGLLT